MRWAEIKAKLQALEQREVLKLVKDLYERSEENKRFVIARFATHTGANRNAFKREIASALNPDFNRPIDLRRGRKAISDFRKAAPSDLEGLSFFFAFLIDNAVAQDGICRPVGSFEAADAAHLVEQGFA